MAEMRREPIIAPEAMDRLFKLLWAACVVVYLVVFLTSLTARVEDVWAMGRAAAATIAVAVLGRVALTLLEKAEQEVPVEEWDPTAGLGSLVDLMSEGSEDFDDAQTGPLPSLEGTHLLLGEDDDL